MARAKKTTAITTFKGEVTKENVPQMLDIVINKINTLKGDSKDENKTSGSLESGGESLENITDLVELGKMFASISAREEAYSEASKEIFKATGSIKLPAIKFNKATANAWKHDIIKRIKEVSYADEMKKLLAVKERLQKHLSEEDKFASDMADIVSILN